MIKKILQSLIVLILLSIVSYAQTRVPEFKVHDRGMLWETMNDNGTIGAPNPMDPFQNYPSMDWPGGASTLPLKQEQRSYMVAAGMWIAGKKGDGSIFFNENGPFSIVDEGTFKPIEKIENYVGSVGYNPHEAEQVIKADFTTSDALRVQRTSRSWSFEGINNFIIIEYEITNTSSENLSDVYVGFPALIRPSYQDLNVHNGWGDDGNRSDEVVAYDATRNLLYAYDDTPNFSLPGDVGNWWEDAEELRTPGYAGYAILDATPASDARVQPANVFFTQLLNNTNKLTTVSVSEEVLYNVLNGVDKSLQTDPNDRIVPFMLLSCGPYNISAGNSVKIVVVEAVDGLEIEDVINVTADNLASKQSKLPQGLGLLQSTIDRAKTLYNNNYVLSEVAPPAPELEIIPNPNDLSISLKWNPVEQEWINPISGKTNFKEYRVFRSDRSYIGPYKRLDVIRPGRNSDLPFFDKDNNTWTFKDTTVQLGVGYYYAVTSGDSAGARSFLTNRNEMPIRATRTAAPNALNVAVFPNPFKEESGFPSAGDENIIVFMNLPAKCTIRIYTSSGDLIRTLKHNNSNSGEKGWDQLNNARQKVTSGIYYWTVSSNVGDAKGTLLIIK